MPKTIPTNGQTNWGTALNSHIGQLMDPTTGGFNFVNNVEERNARFPSVADNEGATVYNKSTGTFQVLESGPYTGVRWADLGRAMTNNAQIGAGTLTYGINNAGNPSAGDFYQYLQSSDNNLETYVKKGDYIKPNNRNDYLYLVGDKVAANKFKISVALDKRPENNIVNGPSFTITPGTRDFTVSVADYVQPGDVIIDVARGVDRFAVEKVNGTTYRADTAPGIGQAWTIERLKRPITNFSQWEVVKVTFNVNDQLLVNPNKTITLNGGNLVYPASTLTTEKTYTSSTMGNAGSFNNLAVATGTTISGVAGIRVIASIVRGNSLNSALSSSDTDWAGTVTNLSGIQLDVNQAASPNMVTDAMKSYDSTATINKGKVKNVYGVFLNQTSMHGATASEVQMPDTVWGIYQLNSVRGALGTKMAKNMFQGNVLIKDTNDIYNTTAFYAEADERLVVDGNIKFTGGYMINTSAHWVFHKALGIVAGLDAYYFRRNSKADNTGTWVDLMKIHDNGAATLAGALTQNSDITLKKNVTTLSSSLNVITSLRGVNFEWKDEDRESGKQVGFIAQEVEKVLPEVVKTDDKGIKSVGYANIVPVLVEAIKELKAEIDELKKRA